MERGRIASLQRYVAPAPGSGPGKAPGRPPQFRPIGALLATGRRHARLGPPGWANHCPAGAGPGGIFRSYGPMPIVPTAPPPPILPHTFRFFILFHCLYTYVLQFRLILMISISFITFYLFYTFFYQYIIQFYISMNYIFIMHMF